MILACNRLTVDGIALTQGTGAKEIPHWQAFKMTCVDWRVWAQCFLFVLVTGSQTMQYFIPTLVKSFGWKGAVGQCMYRSALRDTKPMTLASTDHCSRSHHSSLRCRARLRCRIMLAS
jgi:hypothetical protein